MLILSFQALFTAKEGWQNCRLLSGIKTTFIDSISLIWSSTMGGCNGSKNGRL